MKKLDPIGWHGSTPPSLIQQRMAIDRTRTRGLFEVCGGSALLAIGVAQLTIVEVDVFDLLQTVVAVTFIALGIRDIAQHKRQIADFEGKHGKKAGSQDTAS
jgi:hypothetical protein